MTEASELIAALARARLKFAPIRKTRTVRVQSRSGGSYSFSYAPLDEILASVAPALAAEGIALMQDLDGDSAVVTILAGHGQELRIGKIKLAGKWTTPQEQGSELTYARRYSLTLALCLSSEDDDDANLASGNSVVAVKEKPAGNEAVQHGDLDPVIVEAIDGARSLDALAAVWASIPAEDRRMYRELKDAAKARFASGGVP